jgi:hypothetical protein
MGDSEVRSVRVRVRSRQGPRPQPAPPRRPRVPPTLRPRGCVRARPRAVALRGRDGRRANCRSSRQRCRHPAIAALRTLRLRRLGCAQRRRRYRLQHDGADAPRRPRRRCRSPRRDPSVAHMNTRSAQTIPPPAIRKSLSCRAAPALVREEPDKASGDGRASSTGVHRSSCASTARGNASQRMFHAECCASRNGAIVAEAWHSA